MLGETRNLSFEAITVGIRLIEQGARFIATNPDVTGPSPQGPLPATGSVAALVTKATGVDPYFIGKPNPLMMRSALNRIEAHSETTVMVGDRMDTDVISGLEAGMRTVLVLTGSTAAHQIDRFPYRASRVVDSVADIVELVTLLAPENVEAATRSLTAAYPPLCADTSSTAQTRRYVGTALTSRSGHTVLAACNLDSPPAVC